MDFTSVPNYRFRIGDLVHHRRYHYRGVVFAVDPVCRAGEDWYLKNQTQPERNQPWYHVMVDGALHTTYVAEGNLEADQLGGPVEHPLLHKVFQSFHNGRYYKESMN